MRCYSCMEEYSEGKCPKCGSEQSAEPKKEYQLAPGTELDGRYVLGYAKKQTAVYICYIAWDKQENKAVLINEYYPSELACRVGGESNVEPQLDKAKENAFKSGMKAFKDECLDLAVTENTDVIASFEANRTYYCVRKIMTGLSVASLLANDDFELTDDYARRILILLLRTLHKVNKLGIIHGNICPETIYFNEDTSVTITDFSFCGYMSRVVKIDTNAPYTPLEMYEKGAKLTTAVDVYSAAAVFYTLLTGTEIPQATQRVNLDILIAPSVKGHKMRRSMEFALLNALNVRPENRTQTVNEFYSELKAKDTKRNWERTKKEENVVSAVKEEEEKKGGASKLIAIMAFAIIAIAIGIVCIQIGNIGRTTQRGIIEFATTEVSERITLEDVHKEETTYRYVTEASTEFESTTVSAVPTTVVTEKRVENTTRYNAGIKPLTSVPSVIVERADHTVSGAAVSQHRQAR